MPDKTAKAVKVAVLRHGWALIEVETTADLIALAETLGDQAVTNGRASS
jgi:hypothetical protein